MTTIFRKNKRPFKARHIQLNSFIRKAVGEYAYKHGVTASVVVNKVERNNDEVIIDFKDSTGQAHVIHKELRGGNRKPWLELVSWLGLPWKVI